jgi:hypothetical protein
MHRPQRRSRRPTRRRRPWRTSHQPKLRSLRRRSERLKRSGPVLPVERCPSDDYGIVVRVHATEGTADRPQGLPRTRHPQPTRRSARREHRTVSQNSRSNGPGAGSHQAPGMSVSAAAFDRPRSRVTMMAPRMSRTHGWLRLRGMTKVTAHASISLDRCHAGPMDPRDPQDAAAWMQGPEVPDRRGDLYVPPRLLGDGARLDDVADGFVRKPQNLGRR